MKGLRQLRALQGTWDAVEENLRAARDDRLHTGADPSREIRALPDTSETPPEEEDPWAFLNSLPERLKDAGVIFDQGRHVGVYKVLDKHLHVANSEGDPLGSCTLAPGENVAGVAKQLFRSMKER